MCFPVSEGLGERQSCTACWPLQGCVRVCFGPRPFPYVEIISPSQLVRGISPCLRISSLFWVWCVLLCSAWSVCIWYPTAISVPSREKRGFFTRSTRGVYAVLCWLWGKVTQDWPCGIKAHYGGWSYSASSCLSKVLHPVSVGVVSFLATLTHANQAVGWHLGIVAPGGGILSAVESFHGGSNRCHLLNKSQILTSWRGKRPNAKTIRLMVKPSRAKNQNPIVLLLKYW